MSKARAANALFDLLGGGVKRGVRSFDEGLEAAARSGNYRPYELELARQNAGYNPRKNWQGGANEPLLFGQTGNATPRQDFGEAVRTAQNTALNRPSLDSSIRNPNAPNLRPGTENYLGNTIEPGAREWYTPGGGQDQALEAILKIKRGKFKGTYTIDQLLEMHKNAKSSGDKTFLKGKIDEYESMLATGPAKDADDIIVYKGDLPEAKTAQLAGTEGYKAPYDKSLEFHHKSMKRLEGVFWRKAKEFLRLGKADVDDLANLHKQSQVMGVESGSRGDAAVFMHRPVHNEYLHKAKMIPEGIEPRTHKDLGGGKLKRGKNNRIQGLKGLDAETIDALSKTDVKYKEDIEWIMNWVPRVGIEEAIRKWRKMGGIQPTGLSEMDEWVKRIEKVKSFEELMELRREMLENIAQPMTREAELLEETIENWNPKDIQGLRDDPNAVQKITEARDAKELSKFLLREHQIEEAIRQGKKPPEPLPDPEYTAW
tara:strand:+ start:55 stop:1509 length:1455 start_codon:yes stop_codon:yes gene_type:complete